MPVRPRTNDRLLQTLHSVQQRTAKLASQLATMKQSLPSAQQAQGTSLSQPRQASTGDVFSTASTPRQLPGTKAGGSLSASLEGLAQNLQTLVGGSANGQKLLGDLRDVASKFGGLESSAMPSSQAGMAASSQANADPAASTSSAAGATPSPGLATAADTGTATTADTALSTGMDTGAATAADTGTTTSTAAAASATVAQAASSIDAGAKSSTADDGGPAATNLPSSETVPVQGASSNGGPVDPASVRSDLATALKGRPGETSGRYIGRDGQIDKWSSEQIGSLARGIATAQQFYPNIPPGDLQHLIIAEGCQESSGDPTLNVGGGPGAGQGFMQVTEQSVVKDFKQFGAPIRDPSGAVVVDPKGPINLADPAQNVALWGWYSRNVASAGQSLDERLTWKNPPSDVTRDFGNAQLAWLAGPHNDRHTNGAGAYEDYHKRISDYFVQSGFGSQEKLNQLLDTKLPSDLVGIR